MKTSLIINPVAFRSELYKCFFWYRPFIIHGKVFIAVPGYMDTEFIISFHDAGDLDPRDYRKLPLKDAIHHHKFNANDCVAMRSTSPEDYYQMFFAECSIIEKEMGQIVGLPQKKYYTEPWEDNVAKSGH
jgi:hypothetical protein